MNNLAAAGFGCVAALALWKGTKERWIPTLFGMFIVVVTMKLADKTDFPWDYPIIWAGIAILIAGAYGLKWYDKKWCKSSSPLTPEPLEFSLITTGNYEVDGIGEDSLLRVKGYFLWRGAGGPLF